MLNGLRMSDWEPAPITPKQPRAQSQKRLGEYTGAVIDRLQGFVNGLRSEDMEIKSNLMRLRAHSRDLARNNVWMRRFIKLVGHQVVGATGLTMQSNIRMGDGTPKTAANQAVEAAWKDWCRKGTCTMDGRMSFVDVQLQSVRGAARDGEAFWRKIRGASARNRFGFALQALDPDQLDIGLNEPGSKNANAIVMGVEIDTYDRPIAFHFWTTHPTDPRTERKRIRVPAGDIVHFYASNRASQTRGVPWTTSCMWLLSCLGAYMEAEISAARAESERLGFIYNELGDGVSPEQGAAENPTAVNVPSQTASWWELPAGYKVDLPDVRHPNANMGILLKEMLQGIAVGANVSYHSLTGDLASANYSSLRQGALDERDGWKEMQQLLVDHLCQDIFSEWLDLAVLSGAVSIAPRDMDAARYPMWEPRGWEWVDPLKDSKASIMDIEAGLDTRTRVCAERGRNFEEVLRRLVEEKAMADAAGIDLSAVKDPEVQAQDVTEGQPTTGGKANAA